MTKEQKTESILDEFPSNEKNEEELFADDTEETPKESEESTEPEKDEESTEDTEETEESKEDTAADSSPESEETDKPSQEGDNTPDDEDNVPFHKHPRWKKLQEEKDQERKEREKLEKEIEDLKQSVQPQEDTAIPDWFADAFGTDDAAKEAFKKYQTHQKQEREQMKKEIIEEQTRIQQEKEEQVDKWNQWVQDEVESLKADGKKFDKNELLDIALEWKPTDEDGNISLRKAYELLEFQKGAKQKKTTEKKKEVSAKTASNNRGSDTQPQKPSPGDIRRKSWRSLMENLPGGN